MPVPIWCAGRFLQIDVQNEYDPRRRQYVVGRYSGAISTP